jgi:hypothetical protein
MKPPTPPGLFRELSPAFCDHMPQIKMTRMHAYNVQIQRSLFCVEHKDRSALILLCAG